MPDRRPTPEVALNVPTVTSMTDSTIEMMMLNKKKNQYSLRRARPEKTAYFFSTCRYQFMRPPVDSSCYRVLMLRLGKLRLRGTGRKEGLGPGAPPGFLPGRVERDPGRCVVARLLESAHPGVDAGVGKARRELVAQDELC